MTVAWISGDSPHYRFATGVHRYSRSGDRPALVVQRGCIG